MIILQETGKYNFTNLNRDTIYARLYAQYKNGFLIIPEYLKLVYIDEWNDKPGLEIHKDENWGPKESE